MTGGLGTNPHLPRTTGILGNCTALSNSGQELYYQNFSVEAFKDKVRQEIQTTKYLHTLKVRGKDALKIKTKENDVTNELAN
jgi:hypothetical protein